MTLRQPLTRDEIEALADAFHDEGAARLLLDETGIRRGRQPVWGGSSLVFWGEVSHRLATGLMLDGRRRLLTAAGDWFPGNPVFAAGLDARSGCGGACAAAERLALEKPGPEDRSRVGGAWKPKGIPGAAMSSRDLFGVTRPGCRLVVDSGQVPANTGLDLVGGLLGWFGGGSGRRGGGRGRCRRR